MRNTVLIVGAIETNDAQLFFERALAADLVPVLVTKKPPSDRRLRQYENRRAERMSVEGILRVAQDYGEARIAGVYSAMSQYTEVVARVARMLGTQHSDVDAVAACRDKFLTRESLAAAGIRDVGYRLVRSGMEAERAASVLGGRVIVKPRASSGATGVCICGSPEAARHYVEGFLRGLKDKSAGVAIEEYIEGPQYGVEIFDGRVLGVRRKHIAPPPASMPIGHDFPTLDDISVCAEVATHAERAVAAIGYLQGPAHVEVRYGASGPALIEINPRIPGALGPENVRRATGIDLVDASIRFACGLTYDLRPKFHRASAVRHLLRDGPAVANVVGRENALAVPGVVEVGIFRQWFSRVGPANSYADRVAYVLSEASTPTDAIASADEGLRQLKIIPQANWKSAVRGLFLR